MTKRVIDADALFKHIKQILKTAISEREYYCADRNVYLSHRNPPKSALKTLKTVLFEIEDAFVKLPRKLCLKDSSVDDNELATPAHAEVEQGIDIFNYFTELKSKIDAAIEKPLEDSLLGITADNAYIAGLRTALIFAEDVATHSPRIRQ